MFKRLVATSRAPQIMVLSMLRSFGKIGPQIDRIWAWLSRGHRWSAGVRNPLKSSVTGPSLLVNCYLEIKFHKIIRVNPPPLNSHFFWTVQLFFGVSYFFWAVLLNSYFCLGCPTFLRKSAGHPGLTL